MEHLRGKPAPGQGKAAGSVLVQDQDPVSPCSQAGLLLEGAGLPAGMHTPSPGDLRAGRSWQWKEEHEAGIIGSSSHISLFQEKCLCPLISTAPKRPSPNELKLLTTTPHAPAACIYSWLSKQSPQLPAHIHQRIIPST